MDPRHEAVGIDGFLDVVVRAGLEEFRLDLVASRAGPDENRERGGVDGAPHMIEDLAAVHTGHRQIENDELVVLIVLENVERPEPVLRILHLVAVALEERAHEQTSVLIVVDQQNPRRALLRFGRVLVVHPPENTLHLHQRGLA